MLKKRKTGVSLVMSLRNALIIVTFATAPFIFLNVRNYNIALFDVLLILSTLVFFFRPINLRGNYKAYYLFSFVFLIVAWMSISNSLDRPTAISTTVQYSFILLILFSTVGKALNLELYRKIVIAMGSAWCLFAIRNLTLLKDPNYLWGGGAGRFVSYFVGPGEVGLVTAVMTPFLLYCLLSVRPRDGLMRLLVRLFFLLGNFANLAMLIASGSRSGLVALIAGMLVLVLMKYGVSFRSVFSVGFLVVVSLVITSTLGGGRNAISRLSTNENIDARFNDYKLVYSLLKENFWLGTGLGSSAPSIQAYGGAYRPHNFFFDIIIEAGTIGVICMLFIIGLSLFFGVKILWHVILNKKSANFLVATTFSAGLTLLICQQFTTIANYRGYWLIWAICLWISTQTEHFYEKEERRRLKIIWR